MINAIFSIITAAVEWAAMLLLPALLLMQAASGGGTWQQSGNCSVDIMRVAFTGASNTVCV